MLRRLLRAIVRLAFGLILSFVLVVLVGGAWVFWRALPSYSGIETLPGLSAEVRVWRDAYGVPHIFAADMDDAARALGYLHASERLFQMEASRRVGEGRAAETFGADFLKLDKFIRALGLYRQAEASFAALSPTAQKRLQAYADGVNTFLERRRDTLPPEFLIVGDRPEPWKPADSLVWFKLMALQLSQNREQEALRAQIAAKLGPDKVSWFFPGPRPGDPITTEPAAGESHASLDGVDEALGALTGLSRGASNEWVLSGARTVTGKPILANDPHLGFGAPILWYLARIVTPDGWIKGATVPGAPIVLLGQNDHIAWGLTTANTDTQDLFVETIDPTDSTRYLTPDGPKRFETREETIRVKDGAAVTVTMRTTRHGPVLSDVSDELAGLAGPGKAIALAFTGLSDRDTTMDAVMGVDAAKTWDDVLAALRLVVAPTQNLVYADTTGDIGFFSFGLVPVRKAGDGLAPVDGASGAYDWTGWVPFDELPQLHNPSAGFAFNANNAVVAEDRQSTFGQDWEETFRARRIQALIGAIDKHSLETSAAMQADRLSLAALALKPFIARIAPSDERARQAQKLIADWDGAMDKDRPEPLIFTAFLGSLRRILIEEKSGLAMEAKGQFAATTLMSLMTDHPVWCDGPGKPDPDCRAALGRAFDEGLALIVRRDGPDMSQWRWGNEHVSLLQHRVFTHIPVIDRLSDIVLPAGGSFYTLDRGGGFEPSKERPFARTHGAGFRGIYDLADPEKSRFVIATGESGHIISPHYRDLAPLWSEGRSIVLAGSEDELRKAGARQLVLRP